METQSDFRNSILRLALGTSLLLLIPLIAMQFSEEVNWTLSDFIFAGTLLFGTGFMYKIITRNSSETVYRIAIGFSLFTGLCLIWVNLAVGIIGNENNAINILYFGIIAVGLIGALYVRFKTHGMMYVMFGMAVTQALIGGFAITLGRSFTEGIPIIEILGVNSFFISLFIIAGLLFRYAIKEHAELE